MSTHIHRILPALLLFAGTCLAAPVTAQQGQLNLRSSEYRDWDKLPACTDTDGCKPDQIPWVGYWWAYSDNGIAAKRGQSQSPAEKIDQALERTEQMDIEALDEHVSGLRDKLHPLKDEKRDLVRYVNRKMARGENYRECSGEDYPDESDDCIDSEEVDCACPWRRYRELDVLTRQAEDEVPEVEIDTVTEWEHLNHGQGVAGVQGWWGHCNAWAAAAVLEPEPVREYTTEEGPAAGITWTVGDVKALLTEAYMTMNSSFYGTRVEEEHTDLSSEVKERIRELVLEGKNKGGVVEAVQEDEAHADVPAAGIKAYQDWYRAWLDVSPADFHILSTVYLGKLGRSFVIDRYTGSEVWNQPASAFHVMDVEELSERNDEGHKQMLIRARIEWASDGVEPNEVSQHGSSRHYHHRDLSYTIFLNDDNQIMGEGRWEHAMAPSSQAHPDFIWVPLSDAPARPRWDGSYYENPHLEIDWLHEHVMPHVAAVEEPEPEEPEHGSVSGSIEAPVALVDADGTSLTCGGDDERIGRAEGVIEFTDHDFEVRFAHLTASISHSYVEDLRVRLLYAPPGGEPREVKELRRCTGGRGDGKIELEENIDDFGGATANGRWILEVADHWGIDTGTLDQFTILLEP